MSVLALARAGLGLAAGRPGLALGTGLCALFLAWRAEEALDHRRERAAVAALAEARSLSASREATLLAVRRDVAAWRAREGAARTRADRTKAALDRLAALSATPTEVDHETPNAQDQDADCPALRVGTQRLRERTRARNAVIADRGASLPGPAARPDDAKR